jgi:hypothetical protein
VEVEGEGVEGWEMVGVCVVARTQSPWAVWGRKLDDGVVEGIVVRVEVEWFGDGVVGRMILRFCSRWRSLLELSREASAEPKRRYRFSAP